MKVHLDLSNCASKNSGPAKRRESRRMVMLGLCLQNLGCDVTRNEPRVPMNSLGMGETIPFSHPTDSTVTISPESGHGVVCMQTSVDFLKHGDYYSRFEMVLTHEYQRKHNTEEKIYPIPFPVHNKIVEKFIRDDTLKYYLQDEVGPLREIYSDTSLLCGTSQGLTKIGFLGVDAYGRSQHIDTFSNIYPDLDINLYQDIKSYLGPVEYLERISSWKAGISLPGDTPKTNRWSELALMGTPIVHVPLKHPDFQTRIHPEASHHNCILLNSWDDKDSLYAQLSNSSTISNNATKDYCAGWSILAQAREVIRRFGTLEGDA
jgi:hypothetical protein